MASVKIKGRTVTLPEGQQVGALTEAQGDELQRELLINCSFSGVKVGLIRVSGNIPESVAGGLITLVQQATGSAVDFFAAVWATAIIGIEGELESGYFACLASTQDGYAFAIREV